MYRRQVTIPGTDPVEPGLDPVVFAPSAGSVSGLLSLQPASLEGWIGSRSKWPRANVGFDVAEADRPRVLVWLTGSALGQIEAPSDALLKDMTAAVKKSLTGYYDAAARANLFTAPFMAGVALRSASGSAVVIQSPSLLFPNVGAPLVAIDSYTLPAARLESVVDITNLPHSIHLDCSMLRTAAAISGSSAVEIIAMPQPSLISSDFAVDSIITASVDGVAKKTYHYNAPTDQSVSDEASVQTDIRIIASIPVEDIPQDGLLPVKMIPGALANWKLLKKFTLGGSGSADDDTGDDNDDEKNDIYNPSEWIPYVDAETEPLDLGMPDSRKWVNSVWLRGRYERGAVKVTLYASRHREKWIRIASGHRGWVSALAMAGFRWWKVRITGSLRKGDFFDALTFRIAIRKPG